MKPSELSIVWSAVFVLASAREAAAVAQPTDGPVAVRYGASHWDGTPEADFVGTEEAGPGVDTVTESGWWLRIQGVDTREVPFPTPQSEPSTVDATTWVGVWNNLRGSGLNTYEVVTAANAEGPSGTYVSKLSVGNFGAAPVTFSVFHYLNPDPDGGIGHESAFVSATTPNMITFDGAQLVNGQYVLLGALHYRAGGANARACRTDIAPVSVLLNDTAPTDLDGSGLPTLLSAAGANCGYEWTNVTLNPFSSMYFVISVSSGLPKLSVKGDYDGDNLPDLLLEGADLQTQGVDVWGMRRTERRQVLMTLFPGTTAFDDFNGDFENDLLFRDRTTGDVLIYPRTSGLGPFGWLLANAPTLASNWILASTADFNADGKADILWRNLTSQKLVVWLVDGVAKIGNMLPTPDAAADANWEVVGANDVNRDGHVDLIWYNVTSGNVVVWYLDGTLTRISGGFTTPPSAGGAGWRVVASGDFGRGTGAERPTAGGGIDLIWQNQVSSALVVWHLNYAAERTSGSFLTPANAGGYKVIGPR